jgi:hypothetical protein
VTQAALTQHDGWEWRTEPDKILLPSSHSGEKVVRVRYRQQGGRNFRSFLLMGFGGEEPTTEEIIRAIEEHHAR